MAEKSITSHNKVFETTKVSKVLSSENQANTWEKTTVTQQVTDGSSDSSIQQVKRFGENILVGEHGSTSSTTIVRSHSTSGELNFNTNQTFSYQQTTGGEVNVNTIRGGSWEMNTFSKDSQYTVSREETSISKVNEESQYSVTQISNTEESSSKVTELGQIIAKLEGEKKSIVQSYQSIITELETKCSRYKNDLTTLEGRIVMLEEENEKLKAEMKTMTDRFQAKTTEFEVSTIKLTQKHGSNSGQYSIKNEELEGKIDILERDIGLLESEKKTLTSSLQEKIIEQNVSTTKLTQEYEAKIGQYEIKNEELEGKIDMLERDIALLEVEKKTLTSSLQEKIIEHNVSTTKLTQEYEAKIGQYEIQNEALEGKIDVLERDVAMLEIEKKTLANSLQENISEHNISTTKLTQEYETKLGQYEIKTEELEGKIDMLERDIAILEITKKTLASSLEEKISEHNISTTKLTQEYETKLGQYEIKTEELDGKIDMLERDIAMLEIEKKTLTNSLQEKTSEHNLSTTKLTQEYETKIGEYKIKIEELEGKVDMLEKDIAMLETEKKALTSSLQEEISEHTISITKLTQEYEIKVRQYKIEIEVFQDKIRELDGNITRLEDEKKSILDSHQVKIKDYEVSITKLTQDYEKKIEQYKVEQITLQVRMKMLEREITNTKVKNEYKTVEKESNSLFQVTTVAHTHSNYDKTNALQINYVSEKHSNDADENKAAAAKNVNAGSSDMVKNITTASEEIYTTNRATNYEITVAKEVESGTAQGTAFEKERVGTNPEKLNTANEQMSEEVSQCRNVEDTRAEVIKLEQSIVTLKGEKESTVRSYQTEITEVKTKSGQGNADDASREIEKSDTLSWCSEYEVSREETSTTKVKEECHQCNLIKWSDTEELKNIITKMEQLIAKIKMEKESVLHLNESIITEFETNYGKHEPCMITHEGRKHKLEGFTAKLQHDKKVIHDSYQIPDNKVSIKKLTQDYKSKSGQSRNGNNNIQVRTKSLESEFNKLESKFTKTESEYKAREKVNTCHDSLLLVTLGKTNLSDDEDNTWKMPTFEELPTGPNDFFEVKYFGDNAIVAEHRYLLNPTTPRNLRWECTRKPAIINDLEQEYIWSPTAVRNLEWENTFSPDFITDREQKQIWSPTAYKNLEWENTWSPTNNGDLEQEYILSTTAFSNLDWENTWSPTLKNVLEQEHEWNSTAVSYLDWEHQLNPTLVNDLEQEHLRSTTTITNHEWKNPGSPTLGKDLKQEKLLSTTAVNNLEWEYIGVPAFISEQKQNGSLTIFWDLTTNGKYISFTNLDSDYKMTTAGGLEASSTQGNSWETEKIGGVITPSQYTVSCEENSTTGLNGKSHQRNLMKMIKTTKDLETKVTKMELIVSNLLGENEKMLHLNRSVIAEPKTKCDLDEIGMTTLDGEMEALEGIAMLEKKKKTIIDSYPKKTAEYIVSTTSLSRDFGKNIAQYRYINDNPQTRLKMLDEEIIDIQQDYKASWKNHDTLSQVTKTGDFHFSVNQAWQMTTILIEGRPYNSFTITAMGDNARKVAVQQEHIWCPNYNW